MIRLTYERTMEKEREREREIEGRDSDKFYRLFKVIFDYLWYTVCEETRGS